MEQGEIFFSVSQINQTTCAPLPRPQSLVVPADRNAASAQDAASSRDSRYTHGLFSEELGNMGN